MDGNFILCVWKYQKAFTVKFCGLHWNIWSIMHHFYVTIFNIIFAFRVVLKLVDWQIQDKGIWRNNSNLSRKVYQNCSLLLLSYFFTAWLRCQICFLITCVIIIEMSSILPLQTIIPRNEQNNTLRIKDMMPWVVLIAVVNLRLMWFQHFHVSLRSIIFTFWVHFKHRASKKFPVTGFSPNTHKIRAALLCW